MQWTPTRRLGAVAFAVLAFDQLTKLIVLHSLGLAQEQPVVQGFFKLVHWTNRGAAWSLFHTFSGSNLWLGLFAIVTLVVLLWSRRHFDVHTLPGQVALGLICGGVTGNLVDRIFRGHVIDFLYFYVERRGGGELGFPAFNVADTAICTGVGLLFLMSWHRTEPVKTDSVQGRTP